jgi:hypothetical protein
MEDYVDAVKGKSSLMHHWPLEIVAAYEQGGMDAALLVVARALGVEVKDA